MSVVVVTKDQDVNTLVADSAVSTVSFVNINGVVKVHTVGDDFVLGFCGNPEILTMFKAYVESNPIEHIESFGENQAYAYMSKFYEHIEDRGFSVMGDAPESFEVVIVTPWRILVIQRYFIHEVDQFYAIGSGDEIALSALHLGKSAEEAAALACDLNPWCSLPLVVRTVQRKYQHEHEDK